MPENKDRTFNEDTADYNLWGQANYGIKFLGNGWGVSSTVRYA